MVARKQSQPGSASSPEKAQASGSPRRDTGSPRPIRKGPPVAKQSMLEDLADSSKVVGPKKPPRVFLQEGESPISSPRTEPVKPEFSESEARGSNQPSPEANGKFLVFAYFDSLTLNRRPPGSYLKLCYLFCIRFEILICFCLFLFYIFFFNMENQFHRFFHH